MKLALSTNWCNRRLECGEAIVDRALAMGFEALELGFHTTREQVDGFRRRLDEMPVGSVHAFCPVPVSAPQGYPELYQLASFDEDARAIALVHVKKNIEFAASMGATALVLHAGRVPQGWLFRARGRHVKGLRMVEVVSRELERLEPVLEQHGVELGLENLPYIEGFPNAEEMALIKFPHVKRWLDTGHEFVGITQGWEHESALETLGFHLNDSQGGDDHLAPGEGKVDFSRYRELAKTAKHFVFEPAPSVTEAQIKRGMEVIRAGFSSISQNK